MVGEVLVCEREPNNFQAVVVKKENSARLIFAHKSTHKNILTAKITQTTVICACSSILYQHWTKINKPTRLSANVLSLEWPEERYSHAATCVSGPLLVIMGGFGSQITSDCWIYDFTAMLWKKVHVHVLMYFRSNYVIDLELDIHSSATPS